MPELIFYEDSHGNSPAANFITQLDEESQNNKYAKTQLKQIIHHLDILEKLGTRCKSEYVKHVRDNIWELRPGPNRILFFVWTGNKIILLHPFRKRTPKTPLKEIVKAKNEMADWISRNG